jgi:hypothetical protein
MKKLIPILLLSAYLSGCGTNKKPEMKYYENNNEIIVDGLFGSAQLKAQNGDSLENVLTNNGRVLFYDSTRISAQEKIRMKVDNAVPLGREDFDRARLYLKATNEWLYLLELKRWEYMTESKSSKN